MRTAKLIALFTLLFLLLAPMVQAEEAQQGVINPAPGLFVDLGENTFPKLIGFFINGLLGLVGVISILFIIIGGFRYITSGGNEEAAESGKKILTNAIIGLVVVILSYVIVVVVVNALQGQV